MKRLLWTILSVIFININVYAQDHPFSIRVTAGAAHLPMSDWKSFAGHTSFPTDKYTTFTPTLYYGVSWHWKITDAHSVSLGLELLRPKIQWIGTLLFTLVPADTVFRPCRIDWTFRGIPITVAYEYKTGFLKDKFEPVVGFGASVIFSEVKAKSVAMIDIHDIMTGEVRRRHGTGYGIHGTLGFHNKINDHFSSIWQVRYRYSDGMAFTDKPGDIKV